MSIIPAESFNFFEAGVQVGPNFFVLGPLAPGCILRRVRITASSDPNGALRLRWAFALGASGQASEAEFQAGYLPFVGNGEGLTLGGRLPFVAIFAASQTQYFVHEFGRRVVAGAQWIVVALGADASDQGFITMAFEVVGGQRVVQSVGGQIVNVG